MKEGLEDRLEGLRSRKDNMLTIAEIGVDQIVVGEAQEFRKLSFTTNTTGLKGVDPDGSQRAWDIYVKSRFIETKRPGRALILIGSSETMGTGVNVQRRLKALHHLDVPWLPSQIEQREGRIERQGNEHDEIELYAYATLGSMDATMWQNNERKARFIAAALAETAASDASKTPATRPTSSPWPRPSRRATTG